jgi:hypothetical protein
MAMAQAASEHARQAVERADTASIQAAVREAETAALALMMTVQDAGERSPGRGPLPEPPPMLQDRASPAARMDANGKGSSLIGDARIEGDDDDDNDEHAPMRPRHASARAAVPAAVQPAALTRPTALQLQHERELAYGAGALEAYGAGARAYGAPLNLSAALDSVAANMKGRADPTGYLREETRSPIASRGRAKKAKKALVGTTSSASGKGLHGCASAAGASPCRSPLATVAEQAEEPSLAEESSASLVASEEQQQAASSPSPSQTHRQLTLLSVSPWVKQPEKPKGGGEGGTEGGRSGGFGIEGWTYASDGSHEIGSLTEEDLASLAASEEFKSPFDFAMARSAVVAAKKAKKEKHVVVTIDPSRSDVHNAAANLQRVRSSKALAAATSPISSFSFGLAGLESSPFRRASLVELTHFS